MERFSSYAPADSSDRYVYLHIITRELGVLPRAQIVDLKKVTTVINITKALIVARPVSILVVDTEEGIEEQIALEAEFSKIIKITPEADEIFQKHGGASKADKIEEFVQKSDRIRIKREAEAEEAERKRIDFYNERLQRLLNHGAHTILSDRLQSDTYLGGLVCMETESEIRQLLFRYEKSKQSTRH